MTGVGAEKLFVIVAILLLTLAPVAVLLLFAVRSLRQPAHADPVPVTPSSSDVEHAPDSFDVARWSEARVRALMAGAVMPVVMAPVLWVARGQFLGIFCGQVLLLAVIIAATVLMIIITVKRPISSTSKVLWALAIIYGGFIATPFAAYYLVWKPWKRASDSAWESGQSTPG